MNIDKVLLATICNIVILLAVLLYLSFTETAQLAAASKAQSGIRIEQGAALYGAHCRSCHGVRGEGIGQLGPALADKHFFAKRLEEVGRQTTLKDYILATIVHGRMIGTRPIYAGNGSTAVMPPWDLQYGGPLRTDEIQSIALFILNWEATAMGRKHLFILELPAENPNDPKLVARGEHIFRQSCAACHDYKNRAQTTVQGPDLSEISVFAATRKSGLDAPEYIRESILIPAAFIAGGYDKIDEGKACGAVLSITELTAVTAFLLQ